MQFQYLQIIFVRPTGGRFTCTVARKDPFKLATGQTVAADSLAYGDVLISGHKVVY